MSLKVTPMSCFGDILKIVPNLVIETIDYRCLSIKETKLLRLPGVELWIVIVENGMRIYTTIVSIKTCRQCPYSKSK